MAHRSRSALLVSLVAPAIGLAIACGGAIDNGELFKGDEGSSSGSSGTTPTPTSRPTSGPTPQPVPVPPPKPNDKPCVVSFEKEVMQLFENYDCSSAACHGSGLNRPQIDSDDPQLTYKTLVSFKTSGGKPYVAVGSTDPKSSGMYCNLRGDCGVRMPLGNKVDSADLKTLDTWLACGAPFN